MREKLLKPSLEFLKKYWVTGLYIVGLVIFINLILTLQNPYSSIVAQMNNDTNTTTKDLWEMRGQMGDVLSGHFTALAFIGLLISLQYQRKSIVQMGTTINQQNENLIKQSEALHLQIEEFHRQTEEFEHQTTEFKINNYLQIIERNYSRLNDLEASFTYYDSNNDKDKSYRNLLHNLDKSLQIAFRDLEMLVSQLKIIEKNIQFVYLADIKGTLENEYNIYKNLYYKDKIESMIYYTFFKQKISSIIGSDFNRNEFGEQLDGINDFVSKIDEITINIVESLTSNSNNFSILEKQLSEFFIEYFENNKIDFSTFLKECPQYLTPNIFISYFKIDHNLIWDTEPLNISEKVE